MDDIVEVIISKCTTLQQLAVFRGVSHRARKHIDAMLADMRTNPARLRLLGFTKHAQDSAAKFTCELTWGAAAFAAAHKCCVCRGRFTGRFLGRIPVYAHFACIKPHLLSTVYIERNRVDRASRMLCIAYELLSDARQRLRRVPTITCHGWNHVYHDFTYEQALEHPIESVHEKYTLQGALLYDSNARRIVLREMIERDLIAACINEDAQIASLQRENARLSRRDRAFACMLKRKKIYDELVSDLLPRQRDALLGDPVVLSFLSPKCRGPPVRDVRARIAWHSK